MRRNEQQFAKKIVYFGIIFELFRYMMKWMGIALVISSLNGFAQQVDSLKLKELKPVPVYDWGYMKAYQNTKKVILKVYPYALYAADFVDEMENNSANIEKRRKKNKYYKDAYKDLKEDFKFFILDLYTHEGVMLMKLIHRETGLTVYEIAEKYRGKQNAEMFQLMGKLWDQDLTVEFDAEGKDKIAEHVIRDIENGIIQFDDTVVIIDKETYKENMKEYRERKRENHKLNKKRKKECEK